MKLAFLIQNMEASSARYRVLQYLPYLKEQGIDVSLHPRQRSWGDKLRFYDSLGQYDLFVILRKIFPPIEFWYIRKRARRIVYDFDDALIYRSSGSRSLSRWLKFGHMVKRVDAVIAGNEYLKSKALRYNRRVEIVPTTVNLARYALKATDAQGGKITIGWLGSHSTLKYLLPVLPVLERIYRKHPGIRLKIVCDKFPEHLDIPVIRKMWKEADEETDLQSFDIGVMPLTDDPWSRGKCGLKILQYFSVGVPVVCSPVGVNREMVEDGVNGYWAANETEWEARLMALIEAAGLRREMGLRGRRTVEEKFSLEVHAPRLHAFFQQAIQGRV